MRLRKYSLVGLLLLPTVGCSCMNNTEKGAVGGGLIGGIIGTGIGIATKNPAAGAVIGTGVGALAGASVGSDVDQQQRREKAIAQANANRQPPLAINDVVQLRQTGVSDTIIIQQINNSGANYNLTAADITYLHDQGVSDGVIGVMQQRRYAAPVVMGPPRRMVVYDPYPPPPPVGVGFVIR